MTLRGTYMDGQRPLQVAAVLTLEDGALRIASSEGELARWPLEAVRRLERRAAGELFGLALDGTIGAERLEVAAPDAIAAIAAACPNLDARQAGARTALRIAALAVIALASLTGLLVFAVPLGARYIAPMVPARVEANIGRATDAQIRGLLARDGRRLECDNAAGRAALEAATARLTEGVPFALAPQVAVLDIAVPNAIALPGGRIYLFRGLLQRARHPDEVIGVLAHELGHVQHRHGMRAVLEVGTTSFVIGLAIGDFAGAGAVALITRSLINAGHSREAEREADLFAADTLLRVGGDPRALARLLARITGGARNGTTYFDSHPLDAERAALIEARLSGRDLRPGVLSAEQWAALRAICD